MKTPKSKPVIDLISKLLIDVAKMPSNSTTHPRIDDLSQGFQISVFRNGVDGNLSLIIFDVQKTSLSRHQNYLVKSVSNVIEKHLNCQFTTSTPRSRTFKYEDNKIYDWHFDWTNRNNI